MENLIKVRHPEQQQQQSNSYDRLRTTYSRYKKTSTKIESLICVRTFWKTRSAAFILSSIFSTFQRSFFLYTSFMAISYSKLVCIYQLQMQYFSPAWTSFKSLLLLWALYRLHLQFYNTVPPKKLKTICFCNFWCHTSH